MKHSIMFLALSIATLSATSAHAQTNSGTIKSINQGRADMTLKLGDTLKVSVEGNGVCKSITFIPGDTPMAMMLSNITLPSSVKHRYTKAGKFVLKVEAGSPDCSGKGEMTVIVKE